MKRKMDRLTSRIFQQKHFSYKCQFYTKVKASPSLFLKFKTRVWAEYKDKLPNVSDSHRNIGTSCNSKLKLPDSKIYVSKIQNDY